MKVFGMSIAIGSELDGVLKAFGKVDLVAEKPFKTYKVTRDNAIIYVVASGVGELASSAATQYLITKYDVSVIFNFGFVGSLSKDIKCQQVVAVSSVVHYEIDTSFIDNIPVGRYVEYDDIPIPVGGDILDKVIKKFPNLQKVRLASGDKFICSSEKKDWLVNTFNAEICDMEGAGIVLTADKNGVPVISVKVVSDNADEGSTVTFNEIAKKGTEDCANIIVEIVDELSK